jgi:hypothetical protein
MKSHALLVSLWLLLVFCVQQVSYGKDAPKWEIKTRTLAHAEGYPDSRKTFGGGEWVELKLVPETITNVEWVIEGDSVVTNRFGNPTILLVGFAGKPFSFSALVHENPQAQAPESKNSGAINKWRALGDELPKLEKVAYKPEDFETRCAAAHQTLYPMAERTSIESLDMESFIKLLSEMDRLSLVFPETSSWARLRGVAANAAAFRLGVCLDSTADKSQLPPDFWKLLRACVSNLESLEQQFEAAGGEANSSIRVYNGNRPPFEGYNPRLSKNALASNLSHFLTDLPFLLYVQIRNALPGASAKKLKEVLLEHGFTQEEIARLLKTAK